MAVWERKWVRGEDPRWRVCECVVCCCVGLGGGLGDVEVDGVGGDGEVCGAVGGGFSGQVE